MGNVAVGSVLDAKCRTGGCRTESVGGSFAPVAVLGGTGVMGWLLKRVEEVMVEVRFVGRFSDAIDSIDSTNNVVPLLVVAAVAVVV